MDLAPHLIRPDSDGIEIDGPKGAVRLRLKADTIVAEYAGHTLFNGNALTYAEEMRETALQFVESIPLPWCYDSQGHQRITDPKQFYEQTFQPNLRGIERLKRWMAIQQIKH